VSPLDPDVPPPGEEIHLPGPSLLPFLLTIGITAGIVGITLGFVFWVPGVILSLVVIVRWIRETREEIEHLPLEHRH
jgi:membrane protein implicated in regulation of membrane protease activity